MKRFYFLLLCMVVVVLAALAQAQTFAILYSFTGGSDGGNPWAGVVQDQAGNLYGTTYFGGDLNCYTYGCGVVYKVTPAGKETVLHTFVFPPSSLSRGLSDGFFPSTPVARDKAGNIYGTAGGDLYGWGTVFKIDPRRNETVLYSFTGALDGCYPYQGLVMDQSGNLYGTAAGCGSSQRGTIFKVDRSGNFTLLHSFVGGSSDGASPFFGHLTMDKFGDLYGVTTAGGSTGCYGGNGCGVLYKLSKSGRFIVLHRFAGGTTDGCYPYGSVLMDNAGSLYGTTAQCGSNHDGGTIWKMSKNSKETILHKFVMGSSDGRSPYGGLARDSKGNLYGVTESGGANGYGALYKLSAKGKLTLLHSFDGSDGASPYGEVLRTAKGTLYGTTYDGSSGYCNDGLGCGTVWSYVP